MAFAILMLSMTAVILVVFGNQSIAIDTQVNAEAVSKAKAALEVARALSRQDFSLVTSIGAATEDIYQKSLDVVSISADTKQVTSNVTWTTGGRNLAVHFTTLLTNAQLSGNKCSPTLTGDWTAPQIYGYADFSSSAGATGVSIAAGKAYVTSDPNSSGTDDFYAIDVSSAAPGVTSLPILGHFSTAYGLTDVQTLGSNSYVAANSTQFQLLVIDVSNPSVLNISKIKAKRDVTAAADTAVGNTLYYANKKIYLGLTISTGKEFHIFDVTDPANPTEVGPGYEVGAAINDIVVKNNIAYLATAANNEIIAINVSDPMNPVLVGTYVSAALTGQSLAFNATNTLYFGRIGGNGNPKLLAFDPTALTTPTWTMNMIKQSGVYSLISRGGLLFMTTADPNDGFQIWDVSAASATVAPTRFDTSPLNIQQSATAGTDCYGNLLYVAQRSNRALQVIGPYVPSVYTLSNGGNISVGQGSSGSTNITKTQVSGTPTASTLNASGLPAGATASFTNGSCTPTCTASISISTLSTTPAGTYPITITGTGGITTTFNLVVTPVVTFNYSISNSGDITVTQGGSGVTTISLSLVSGTTQSVALSATGLPNKATASFSAVSCNPTCSSVLTIITSGSPPKTPTGTSQITVTGTSSGMPQKTTIFTLTVN